MEKNIKWRECNKREKTNGNIVAITSDRAVSTDLGPMNQPMTPDGFYNFVLEKRVLSELGTIKKHSNGTINGVKTLDGQHYSRAR